MLGLRTLIFDVGDLNGAKAFYEKVLNKAPYFDQPFYVGFDVAGYELGLRPAEGVLGPGLGGATGYLGVLDVGAEVERIVALGAVVREAPSEVGDGIITAVLTDPFGNQLGLIHNPHFAPPLVGSVLGGVLPRSIVLERTIHQPRAEVWKRWSSTEGITSWLVPSAKVELRVGGPFELHFMGEDMPAGSRGSERCRVLSFIPERMLSFTWNAPPHLDRVRAHHTWVVLEFEDDGEHTKVRLTHTGWPAAAFDSEPQWPACFEYFERAWSGVLDELQQPR